MGSSTNSVCIEASTTEGFTNSVHIKASRVTLKDTDSVFYLRVILILILK